VEESLRLYGPSHWVPRTARHDLVLEGVPIRGGDRLLVVIQAGDLDPRRYEPPPEARLRRPAAARPLRFSGGPPPCAGPSVAPTELEEMPSVPLQRLPDVRIDAAAAPPRYTGLVVRTWTPLPVTFSPGTSRFVEPPVV